MRHLKKIRETNAGPIDFHWFHDFFLDVSSLSYFFLQMMMLYQSNDSKIRETDAGLSTSIGFTIFLDVSSLSPSFLQMLILL